MDLDFDLKVDHFLFQLLIDYLYISKNASSLS